jgi:Domain of unknown function (DUF4476)
MTCKELFWGFVNHLIILIVMKYIALILLFVGFCSHPVFGQERRHREGSGACGYALNQQVFNSDYGRIVNLKRRVREREVFRFVDNNCLATDQVRQLAMLLGDDREKSRFLFYAYRGRRVTDIGRYADAGSVFESQKARYAFFRFLKRSGIPTSQHSEPSNEYDSHYGDNGHSDTDGDYDRDNGGSQGDSRGSGGQGRDNGGDNRGGDNRGGDNRGGDNRGGDNRGGDNRGGDNRGGDNRGGDNRGGGSGGNSGYPSGGQGRGNGDGQTNRVVGLNAADFAKLKAKVSAKGFDSGRLEVSKTVTKENTLSSVQIKELMGLLSFEASKLEYAKFAFPFCADPENYEQLNELFAYKASKMDLSNFIKKK